MMKSYKIKLEDKAAFLNRLEKYDIDVDSYEITDNKIDGYFTFTPTNPSTIDVVKDILKKSPKIDQIKEIIRQLVREELLK